MFSNGQEYDFAVKGIHLGSMFQFGDDEVYGASYYLRFPTIAFRDHSCDGRAHGLLSEDALDTLEYFRQRISEEDAQYIELIEDCLVFLHLEHSEALALMATISASLGVFWIETFGLGSGARTYEPYGVIRAPDIFYEAYRVQDPSSYAMLAVGYLVFEYDPSSKIMYLHSYRYDSHHRV